MAAIVTYVWNDRLVDLMVLGGPQGVYPRTSVPLIQDGEMLSDPVSYCEWMPYQKQVAKGEIAPTLHAQPEKKT